MKAHVNKLYWLYLNFKQSPEWILSPLRDHRHVMRAKGLYAVDACDTVVACVPHTPNISNIFPRL